MAAPPPSHPAPRAERAPAERSRAGLGGALVGVALLPLLLHVEHQPVVSASLGAAELDVALSDVAALVLVVAALVAARSHAGRLRPALWLWAAAAGVLLWIVLSTLHGAVGLEGYDTAGHAVTAAKTAEYALLALVPPLLLRTAADVRAALAVLVAWTGVAAAVGVAQFLGADVLGPWTPGFRQPSFLGHHDFAALAGVAVAIGLASLALGRPFARRAAAAAALAAGGIGLVVAASLASALGVALACAALLGLAARGIASPRAVAAGLAVSALVAGGVLAFRGDDVADFLRFAGTTEAAEERREDVETYAHRTVLLYIGWRIFLDHPLAGAGWQASTEPAAFEPYVPAAMARFPDAAPLAFPAAERPHGVQNAYVQALADLGLVGAALLAALFASGLVLAARAVPLDGSGAAAAALLALLVLLGVWSAQGLVTGIPMAALTWLALGLTAAGAAFAREARA